jgi:hypothetical protein
MKNQKPATPASRFMSGLMGRLDQALRRLQMKQYVEQLKGFKPTKPFHKLPGYVKRERVSAGARRKQAAAAAKAASISTNQKVSPACKSSNSSSTPAA